MIQVKHGYQVMLRDFLSLLVARENISDCGMQEFMNVVKNIEWPSNSDEGK